MSRYAKTVEQQLNEHIGSLNTLIAGIAHEINTPVGVCVTVLSRMRTSTDEIFDKFNDGKLSKTALSEFLAELRQGVEIGQSNVARAAALIANFKKMSVDQSSGVFERLDLVKLIRDTVSYVMPAVKKQIENVEITAPDVIQSFTCAGSIAQIFTNLIMNASVHAFEGMDKKDCKVTINLEQDGDHVQIVFSDNGRGMSEEALGRLFQPFYTSKRDRGGSGLGCHIIQTLTTKTLGGSVKCVSAVGKGTSFILRLPLEVEVPNAD
jgi:signal transduction histidine kinase